MTDSDRELLAPLLATGEAYAFGRSGGSPPEIAELDRIATRLLELEHEGVVEILGEPMKDARGGDHYYLVRARLTPRGRDALRAFSK